MNGFKRLFANKKVLVGLLVLVVIAVFSTSLFVATKYFNNRKTHQKPLTQQDIEDTAVFDKMVAGQMGDQEIATNVKISQVNQLIGQKKYKEAKQQIDKLLSDSSMKSSEKQVYVLLQGVCLPLSDFECVDKVIAFNPSEPDIFFMVDAANLAKSQQNQQLAKKYYAAALAEIDKKGGKQYLEKVVKNTQYELKYEDLVEGAK